MAGKRLLDAAKLLHAGRSIAAQHWTLRKEQWHLFTHTSLAKAAKTQTDRVTLTVGAAIELAKRVNDTTPAWQDEVERTTRRATAEAGNVARDVEAPARNPGPGAVANDVNADDGTLASLRRHEQQQQQQRAAARVETRLPTNIALDGAQWEGPDTFSERPKSISHAPSKRPGLDPHADHAPLAQDGLPKNGLNSDVFLEPADQHPNDINLDAFHSPRVSRMFGESGGDIENPYASRQRMPPKPLPEMLEAEKRRKNVVQSASVSTDHSLKDSETQDLAASIAKDAEQSAAIAEPEPNPYEMHESRVPATRFGRLWQYGGLATSMAFGAVGEGVRRLAGGSGGGSLILSEGNMNRLVAKLSRMRGAALKLGQMMSFQDSKILPPAINTVLQRVQDSADYMPASQRDKALVRNLGQDWRDLFSRFEEKPFAAASIGQVHKATLKSSGRDVAVKIQYPGVRNSIDSDLNNLSLLLTASQLLPRGLFLDKTIANARTELAWECDYEREAKACARFKNDLLHDETDTFSVPQVFPEASGPDILTAEFMHGTAVTKIKDLTQHERNWIGTQILRLCLRELMEWRFMQTDPNWTNFLYNRSTQKLELLDFGASRDFPDKFVEPYVSLLIAASKNDQKTCRDLSIQLGYLTGHESEGMLKAHVESILTLAEPFVESAPRVYEFEDQTITDRVRSNIGLMLKERMAPPPEETYSLHRKLSGAFLLCARLKSSVPAREMFADAVRVWNTREKGVTI